MAARIILSDQAVAVLRAATCNGSQVKLNSGQLPSTVYKEVDEALKRLGGRWRGGKVAAHIFPDHIPPQPLVRMVAASGEMPPKNPTQLYPTPRPTAEEVLTYADLDNLPEGAWVLEPSAGLAGLITPLREHEAASRIARIDAVEILEANAAYLRQYVAAEDARVKVWEQDFEKWTPEPDENGSTARYDLIVMNPPFKGVLYARHILRACKYLKPGGVLIAIAPATFEESDVAACRELRTLCKRWGDWDDLPDGAFEESGTGVSTVVLHMHKPLPHESCWRDKRWNGHANWWTFDVYVHTSSNCPQLDRLCGKLKADIRNGDVSIEQAKERVQTLMRAYRKDCALDRYDESVLDWPDLLETIASFNGFYDALSELEADKAADAALDAELAALDVSLGDDEEPVVAAPTAPAGTLGQLARELEATVAEIAADVAALVAEVEGTQADAGPVVALAEPAPADSPAVPTLPAAPATGGKKRGKRGAVPDAQLALPIW